MKPKILSRPNSLADEDPRLRKAVNRTQEAGEQDETLNVRHLGICVADVLQDKSADEKSKLMSIIS